MSRSKEMLNMGATLDDRYGRKTFIMETWTTDNPHGSKTLNVEHGSKDAQSGT